MREVETKLQSGTLLDVRVEPDSPEMRAQSMLKPCLVKGRYFVFGRRGSRRYVSPETDIPDHRIANKYPYTISRQHCELQRTESAVIVRDLNSRLGTVVNGQRLGCRTGQLPEVSLGVGEHTLVLGPSDGDVRFRLIVG